MQVIKDTYEWLTVAYGEKRFTRQEQKRMNNTVKGLMIEEFNELFDAIKNNDKKEQINAIADLMFVTLNAPFFKGVQDWETLYDISDWEGFHTHQAVIEFYEDQYIIKYKEEDLAHEKEKFTTEEYVENYFVESHLNDYTALILLDIKSIGISLGFTEEEIEEECRKVFLSNMTKFCRAEEDAIRTVEKYKNGTHPNKMGVVIEAAYKPTGHEEFPYRVERVSDRKLLKADTFKDVDQF